MKSVNLLPPELKKEKYLDFHFIFKYILPLFIILSMLTVTLALQRVCDHYEQTTVQQQRVLNRYQPVLMQTKLLNKQAALLKQKQQAIHNIVRQRCIFSPYLSEIRNLIPPGITIVSWQITSHQNFILTGTAADSMQVVILMKEMEDSPLFRQMVLKKVDSQDSNPQKRVYTFQLNGYLETGDGSK